MTYANFRQLMSNYVPTHYRTHTLGEIQSEGADLLDTTVTVAGFMEANRGKGAICFVDLRDGTGKTQIFLKADNIGEEALDRVQRMTRVIFSLLTSVHSKQNKRDGPDRF